MRGSATPRPLAALFRGLLLVNALLLGGTGCTICPDPFDYSGPVPDGSAPQNDFRARANGITPLGSHPLPWPPVVQAAPRPAEDSRPAIAADESATAVGRDADDAAGATDVRPVAAEAPAEPGVADAGPPRREDEARPVVAVPEAVVVEAILPPPARPRPRIEPPLRETPGWKPRD